MALFGSRSRADRRRDASKPLTNAGAPMTADVTQDRRVTEPGLGPSDSAFVDGSRLSWALPSPVHERSGSGLPHPTGYKLMRCLPHNNVTAKSRISRQAAHRAHRNVPIRKLAPASPPSRPLRAASGGGLRPALTVAASGAATIHRDESTHHERIALHRKMTKEKSHALMN